MGHYILFSHVLFVGYGWLTESAVWHRILYLAISYDMVTYIRIRKIRGFQSFGRDSVRPEVRPVQVQVILNSKNVSNIVTQQMLLF